MYQVLEIAGVVISLVLAGWGFFHQLIVGGAATIFKNVSEKEARLFVMSWVAHGAFMSFVGVISAVLLLFFGLLSGPVQIVLILSGVAMILLSAHVFVTGYGTHIGPVRTGAVLELIYGVYLIAATLIANPPA